MFCCCQCETSLYTSAYVHVDHRACSILVLDIEAARTHIVTETCHPLSHEPSRALGVRCRAMGADSSKFVDFATQLCLSRGKHALPDLDLQLPNESARTTTLISLEHLNVNVPEWDSANDRFWLKAMGLALDSRAQGVCQTVQSAGGSLKGLVWANAGLQQIHMPLGEPPPMEAQKPPGVVGLAYADIMGLRATLREAGVNFSPVPLKDQMSNLQGVGPVALQCTSPTGVKIYAHGIRSETWLTPRGWMDCTAARDQGLGLPSEEASQCILGLFWA